MSIEIIFMRFLKENGLFNDKNALFCLSELKTYGIYKMPFDEFEWSRTIQNHSYWYKMSIKWLIYLYSRFTDLDDNVKDNMSLKELVREIRHIIDNYYVDGTENDIEWYSDYGVDELYKQVDKYQL